MSFLLDTTWVIEHLRANPQFIRDIRSRKDEGLAMSIVSLAELFNGVFRSSNPERNDLGLMAMLEEVEVLDVTPGICRVFGREKAALRRRGTPVGDLDLIIAATALYHDLTHDLTLLTLDRDFERAQALRVHYSPK